MKVKKLRALFLSLILVFSLGLAGAWADEGGEVPDFETYDLGEVLVSGEKQPTSAKTSVTNEITAEQIKATNSHTVAEALRYAPGVRVSTGRKNEPGVNLRGFDQGRILVLIDGVPYYETNYGKLDLNQIPTDNVAKIVVTKGAASVLYGPNAMGGVINIITKKGAKKPTFQATYEMGEHNTKHTSLSHGWKKGIFNYWLNYTHRESSGWRLSDDFDPVMGGITYRPPGGPPVPAMMENGGFRNNSDYNQDAFWAKFGLEFNPDSEYFVNFHLIERDKNVPPNIREERVMGAFAQLCRMPKYDDWGLDFSAKQKIWDPLTLRGKLFYHQHVDDYVSYDDPTYSNALSISRYRDYYVGGSLFADYQPVSWDILRFSYHYKGDSHRARDDEYLPFEESYSWTQSVGFENEFNLIENFSFVAGVSYDSFEMDDVPPSDEVPNTQSEWNPMGGLTYEFSDQTKLFTSVGRKTRFPHLNELYGGRSSNPNLKQEVSVNTTFGLSRTFGEFAWVEFAYFYNHIKDWITRDLPTSTSQYYNVGEVKMWGFELNSQFYPPIENLVVDFAFMYNNASDESDGRATDYIRHVPRYKFDAGMKYTVPVTATRIDLNFIYGGKVYTNLPTASSPGDPTKMSDSETIFNLKITQPFWEYFETYVSIDNWFDRDYELEDGYPCRGRSVLFGLTAKY